MMIFISEIDPFGFDAGKSDGVDKNKKRFKVEGQSGQFGRSSIYIQHSGFSTIERSRSGLIFYI